MLSGVVLFQSGTKSQKGYTLLALLGALTTLVQIKVSLCSPQQYLSLISPTGVAGAEES